MSGYEKLCRGSFSTGAGLSCGMVERFVEKVTVYEGRKIEVNLLGKEEILAGMEA